MTKSSNSKDITGQAHDFCGQYPPVCYQEDEIDLCQLFSVLIRRKWIIFLSVAALTGLAVLYSVLATPKFHILAQIRPGITGYDDHGQLIYGFKAKDIQEWFSKKAYVEILAESLPELAEKIPKITASNARNSNIVSFALYWPDQEEGKKLANLIISYLSKAGSKSVAKSLAVSRSQLQQSIAKAENEKANLDLQKDEINNEIAANENAMKVLQAEITNLEENRKQTAALVKRISDQIETVNRNTADLIELRNKLAGSEKEQLALLMYSNIIQQNISYETNLQQRLSQLRKDLSKFDVDKAKKIKQQKDIELAIKKLVTERDRRIALQNASLDQQIETFKTRLAAMAPVEVVQLPFSSIKPEKPAKAKIIAIAFTLGWFLGICIAFFYEFWANNRARLGTAVTK